MPRGPHVARPPLLLGELGEVRRAHAVAVVAERVQHAGAVGEAKRFRDDDDVGVEAAHDRGDVEPARARSGPERPMPQCALKPATVNVCGGQMPMRCASSSRWYVGSPRRISDDLARLK